MRRSAVASALSVIPTVLALSSATIPGVAHAQGLSGSEVSGIVRLADGRSSENSVVILTNVNTGATRRMRTLSGGAYRFETVEVGTYRLDARAIGSQPATTDSIELHLGDRLRIDITLGQQATLLDDEVIRGGRLRDAGSGGPAVKVAGRAARNIPLMNRDFVNLLQLSSQSLGPQGLWISGQHSRYNAIQIDGAAANDFFGVSITPGSASGSRLISTEAIEEIRILVAPFDVRMGGFAGGIINAVTRTGTNRRTWSTFASLTQSELIGADTAGASVPQFSQLQYGLTASGPVIRDRLHYFLAAEFQRRASTLLSPSVDDSTTGISESTALRIQNAIKERFGFDPGGTSAPDLEVPTGNVFVKLSWHPRPNMSIDLTPSYTTSRRDTLPRAPSVANDGFRLSRSGSQLFAATPAILLKASIVSGSVSNETIAAYTRTLFGTRSDIHAPSLLIRGDAPTVFVGAGSMQGAQGTRTFESVAQLTHNASVTLGHHTLVAGTQDFVVNIRDSFGGPLWGVWTFDSVDSLESGLASKYTIALPSRPGEPLASYRSLLASLYLQDHWQVTSSFRITAGMRGDAGFFPHPRGNKSLLANDTLGNIDTRVIASGNWVMSPRVGFAWTMDNRERRMLRGGIGLFTARPPYAWTTNAYSFTGETQSTLNCTAAEGVPPVTGDIDHAPVTCTGFAGTSKPKPAVTYFEKNFKVPQAIKAVLGFDTQLFGTWLASFDLIAARTRNQVRLVDRNLTLRSTSSEQRAMYGTIAADGAGQPARISKAYNGIYQMGNYGDDRSFSASTTLHREWGAEKMIDLEYTYSRTRDVVGATGFNGPVMQRNAPVDGTLDSRILRRSARDIPHNFVATTVFPAGAGVTGALFFRARSGTPWAFTIATDANADGAVGNDLAYIPRDSSDISLANPQLYGALNDFIERHGCARSQRGHVMKRNSCRNPSMKRLDGRIAKLFGEKGARRIELSADVFNIPNLVNHRWGIIRETTSREDLPLLTITAWDAANNRPKYFVPTVNKTDIPNLPAINKAQVDASRWSIQLGARYDF